MIKKIFVCIIMITIILTAFKIIKCDAKRRSLNLNDVMKPKEVLSWRVEINEKYFDVFIYDLVYLFSGTGGFSFNGIALLYVKPFVFSLNSLCAFSRTA